MNEAERLDFEPISKRKVYEQVIAQIKDLIYSGKLRKGDKLPSERELKEKLQVSRASIREAFSALEMIGLIESKPRGGTYIKSRSEKSMLEPLSLMFIMDENFKEDFLEFRRILEVAGARLAASKRNEEDIHELKMCVERMADISSSEEYSIQADKDFHYSIARASKNNLIYQLLNAISEILDMNIMEHRTILFRSQEELNRLIEQHREILEAIEARDSEWAAEAMNKHYEFVEIRAQELGYGKSDE